ncbi:hypothetical protein [Sphingopyxis flava]|uniref:Uncharacterized protein n=1 Tax=Sphingopyxis flava TaxID=1507287 RepID=A0A1T5DPL9_9SPHN|nr:hypothetical protein [Sphingopyxis flava]SKB73561.1 hypothetical protein SAMN06295937_1015106 [Sphingopyxis flava]
MGMRADRDLWGQALAIESRYGDGGPSIIGRKIDACRRAGAFSEAEFLSDVAACLTQLHTIRGPSAENARAPSASRRDPMRPSAWSKNGISAR